VKLQKLKCLTDTSVVGMKQDKIFQSRYVCLIHHVSWKKILIKW